jgi:hypothetical protein
MQPNLETLGLIAGNRSLPLIVAGQARSLGVGRIVAVGFEGETSPELATAVDELVWLRVGQLSRLIEAFRSRGVKHCVMAGQIAPRNLFDVRPDLRAVAMLWRLKERNAQTIFGAIADELGKDGIQLIEATPWLRPLMPAAGFQLGRALGEDEMGDVRFGFRIAKEVSRLEIGQTVVVKRGTVLAVEGLEGTDACLLRGGELAGAEGGAIAVKVCKPDHDMRFDIPCVGAQTFETAARGRLRAVAFEGGRTLLLDAEAVGSLLQMHRMAALAV